MNIIKQFLKNFLKVFPDCRMQLFLLLGVIGLGVIGLSAGKALPIYSQKPIPHGRYQLVEDGEPFVNAVELNGFYNERASNIYWFYSPYYDVAIMGKDGCITRTKMTAPSTRYDVHDRYYYYVNSNRESDEIVSLCSEKIVSEFRQWRHTSDVILHPAYTLMMSGRYRLAKDDKDLPNPVIYADFLNHKSLSTLVKADINNYDDLYYDSGMMGIDGCIERSVLNGHYHYEVRSGKENQQIVSVSSLDIVHQYRKYKGLPDDDSQSPSGITF